MTERSLFDKPVGRGESTEKIRFDNKVSGEAFKKSFVRAKSVQHSILMCFKLEMKTCEEIEEELNKSHQSVSATLNALMKKDLIEKSGLTKKVASGNLANLWRLTTKGEMEVKRWSDLIF